jgi:hypothetical protein
MKWETVVNNDKLYTKGLEGGSCGKIYIRIHVTSPKKTKINLVQDNRGLNGVLLK